MLKINSKPFYNGLQKDDLVYLTKLEDLQKKKRQLREEGQAEAGLALGKRDPTGPGWEMRKSQVEKCTNAVMLNTPEVKLSYKIEFAKEFLDRKQVDKHACPDILRLALNGHSHTVTAIETNLMAKVLLLGFANAVIKAYYLYQPHSANAETLPPKEPQSNLHHILHSNIKELSTELTECEFIGHSAPITCLSLSFDSSYFVSGSADCTIRLWSLQLGQCLAVFKAHISTVWSLKIGPRGYHFASGGADSLIFLWLTSKSSPP